MQASPASPLDSKGPVLFLHGAHPGRSPGGPGGSAAAGGDPGRRGSQLLVEALELVRGVKLDHDAAARLTPPPLHLDRGAQGPLQLLRRMGPDRKSTRLNSSHVRISYA